MRSKRLYIKIFLSFLAVLCATLLVVFAFFIILPGDHAAAEKSAHAGRAFALGLIMIGLMAVLSVVPVSRIITHRLERLRQSALFISDRLELSITNTFAKLPEEELIAIFDPFHRVKGSGASGAGLGLAIAKKIEEKHGGTIKAYNAGRGLEIRISLILKKQD